VAARNSSPVLNDTLFGINENEGWAHAAAPRVASGLGDFTLNPMNFYTAARVFVEALTRDTGTSEEQLITYATNNMHVWMQNKIIEKINSGEASLNANGKFEGGLWYDDYGVSTIFRATAPAQLKDSSDWVDYLSSVMTDGWAWAVTLGRATWEVDPVTGEVTWTGGTAYDFPKESFPEWFTEWFDSGNPKNIAQYKPQINIDSNLITRDFGPGAVTGSWYAFANVGRYLTVFVGDGPRDGSNTWTSLSLGFGELFFDPVPWNGSSSCSSSGLDGSCTGTITSVDGHLTYDLDLTFNGGSTFTYDNVNYILNGGSATLSNAAYSSTPITGLIAVAP